MAKDSSEKSAKKLSSVEGTESSKNEQRHRGQKKDKTKPPTKIVIRHLPPTMTEEEFLKQIDPLPDHDFYYYAPADWSLGFDATCRAYITLKNYDDVFLFRDRFDGYVFVDSKGAEYPAIVEFAPFQGLLKSKSRHNDPKVNMIEQEEHYQHFLQKLEEDRELAAKGGECKLEFSLDRKKEEKITSTPLLQYLANKKEKRREEQKKRNEEKRRQRGEEKEKRREGQTQSQMQITKIYSGNDGSSVATKESKSSGAVDNKEESASQKDGKDSYLNRRIERNRRRREVYVQRKKERLESKEKKRLENQSLNQSNKESQNRSTKDESSIREEEDLKLEETLQTSKSELQSESKQKQEKRVVPEDGQIQKAKPHTSSISTKNVEKRDCQVKQKSGESRQRQGDPSEKSEKDRKGKEDKTDVTVSTSSKTSGNARQTQRQRSAEERRIRNKDRPSIAIYQPKARLRLSEESDTSASKDVRSNPASDGETNGAKKEEQRSKKVSRYSERRSERRFNKDKPRSSESGDGQFENDISETHKSKSFDGNAATTSAPAN